MESPNSSVLSEADFGNTTCDSDKENVTPRHTTGKTDFRCQSNLLNNTSLFEQSYNDSRAGISPPETSPLDKINSTTSQLNEFINRVTVSEDLLKNGCEPVQRERSNSTNSCGDISEISFDLKPEQRRFSESMIIYDKPESLGNLTDGKDDDYSAIFTPQKPPSLSLDLHHHRLTETTPDASMRDTSMRDTSRFTPKLSTLSEHKVLGTPDVSRRHPFNDSNMDNFPVFSPSVFTDKHNKSDTFKWSIEHISECNPATFSVEQPSYILEEERKDSEDVEYQSHVKSYFSQSRIAPSPLVGGCKSFIPGAGGYSTVECQTDISLPLDFDLEAALEGKTKKKVSPKEHKMISDTSYRRQLFHRDLLIDGAPDQEDLLISPEELQHSPTIKSAPGTPLSDASPSFLIGDPSFSAGNMSNIGFSPIKDLNRGDDNALFRTPGPSSRRQVCTPGDSYILLSTPAHLSVNSEERMLQSTPAPSDSSQTTSNKRKPEDTPEKSSHSSNFKKLSEYSNSPFLSPIARGAVGNIRRHKNCPVKKPKVDTEESPGPRRHVTFRLERAPAPRRPMESSRIDSDVSSEGVSPPNFVPGIQALEIPLDISEIKHPDLTKLRTNNFLDISDVSRKSTPCSSPSVPPKPDWDSSPATVAAPKGEWSMISEDFKKNVNVNETNNDSNKPTNSTTKDSGFSSVAGSSSNTLNTNYTLATHTATLSALDENPLSEVDRDLEKEILLESRPGKRKQQAVPSDNLSAGSSDDSGFCPPPVKRVLNVLDGAAVEIRDPGSSP